MNLRTWMMIPVGLVIMSVLGGFFSLVTSLHHWGITTPVVFVIWTIVVSVILMHFARMARVHREGAGIIFGLIMFFGYFVGELGVVSLIEGLSFLQWYGHRWDAGIELFGSGSFSIRGWFWSLAYASRILVLFFVFWVIPMIEGQRQFCLHCQTATVKTRWKTIVKSFDQDALREIKKYSDILRLQGTTGKPYGVNIRVRTCKCGCFGELRAEVHNLETNISGTRMCEADALSPIGLVRLVEWVEATDPSTSLPDKRLDLERFGAKRDVFDLAVEPRDGVEWETRIRWSGANSGLEWRCDTEYTRALRYRLGQGDYQVVEESLAAISNVNDLACVYEAAADWATYPDWLEIWCDEHPENVDMWTVRGINFVKQAWTQRGSGWVPKNFGEFQSLLLEAMRSLDKATDLDPDNSVAHAWKIYAAKGLGRPNDEVRAYFDLATRNAPDLHAAHWMMFDYLTAKWHGSDEQCVAFAREILARCPQGSPAACTVLFAHCEVASSHHTADRKNGFDSYLNQPDVRSEIIRANAKIFDQHRMSMVTPRVRAMCAYMLWKCGELHLARKHLEIIGKNSEWDPFVPFIFFWTKETVRSARKECGL